MKNYYVTCYFENGSKSETVRLSHYGSVIDYISNCYEQWIVSRLEIIYE